MRNIDGKLGVVIQMIIIPNTIERLGYVVYRLAAHVSREVFMGNKAPLVK